MKLDEMVNEYYKLMKKIKTKLAKKKNWGMECECKSNNIVELVESEYEAEVWTYCLECGGYIEDILL